MNCCPRESASLAPSMRASGSTEPPGGNGTTNFTGFVGQACATTVSGSSAQATNVAAAAARRTTRNMIAPLPGTSQVTIRPMKIAMMGSGGVGGFFGGRLAHAGYDVTFIARGAHLDAMRGRGLSIASTGHGEIQDRKSTRLNSSHVEISYAVFCLKKKKKIKIKSLSNEYLN